jgi:Hint domain
LYVSPNHALLLDGVLIPAIYLVNGSSIVQAMPEGVEEIEYFHVELEIHEVIFAEGAAVETLLDE